jgi:hypothetical protein
MPGQPLPEHPRHHWRCYRIRFQLVRQVGDERAEDDGVDALADREHGCDAARSAVAPSSERVSVAGKTPRSAIAQSALAAAYACARRIRLTSSEIRDSLHSLRFNL